MLINPSQNRRLHQLLNLTGLTEQKANLIFGISEGRTESSKELTSYEAHQMIKYLTEQLDKQQAPDRESANNQRRKIISMCHKMKWYDEAGKIDYKAIDDFCNKRGYLHKPLNDYTVKELPKLVTQFQQVYNSFISNT